MGGVLPNQKGRSAFETSSESLRTHFASARIVEEEGCIEIGTAFPPFSEFEAESCHLQRYEIKASPAVAPPRRHSSYLRIDRGEAR